MKFFWVLIVFGQETFKVSQEVYYSSLFNISCANVLMDDFLSSAKKILLPIKTIAVVGISDKKERSSYGVAEYLTQYYTVIPVNPLLKEWKGLTCYPDLLSIPDAVDLVNVFRRSELVPPIVDEAIRIHAKAIWMQLGVVHEEAALRAQAHGIEVIMDSCIAVVDRQVRG